MEDLEYQRKLDLVTGAILNYDSCYMRKPTQASPLNEPVPPLGGNGPRRPNMTSSSVTFAKEGYELRR